MEQFKTSTNGQFKVRCCNVCRNPTYDKLKVCTGCKTVYYCSPECQKADWTKHSAQCKSITGNGELKHDIDAFACALTIKDIPVPKDSTINSIVAQKLTSSETHLLADNDDIYISLGWRTVPELMYNFSFIIDAVDVGMDDVNIWAEIFTERNAMGKLPVIVWCHDLRHYNLSEVDK